MNEKERDLIERYLYEVTRRIPKEQRADIRMELQALINDMCESASAEEVLTQLGDPAKLACKYRDANSYLIGPEYYDNYLWVMKLVLLGVGISTLISSVISSLSGIDSWNGGYTHILTLFITYLIGNFISSAMINGVSAFGMTTLIFAIMERQKVKVDLKRENVWTPDKLTANSASSTVSWIPDLLPPVPDKRAVIQRSDSIVSIVFLAIFAALFLWAPQLFGAYLVDESEVVTTIPLFNLSIWNQVMPFFLISFFAGLLNEIVRLVTGYYCKAVMISTIVLNAVQLIAAVIAFKLFPVWNADFAAELSANLDITISSKADLLHYWGTDFFSNVILGIICFAVILEIGTAIYKTLRYGKE